MGFNLIHWTSLSGSYFLYGSSLGKFGNFWKNGCFPSGYDQFGELLHRCIWPDWGLWGTSLLLNISENYYWCSNGPVDNNYNSYINIIIHT